MNIRILIPAFLILYNSHADKAVDAFYVWQQLWSTPVVGAVKNEPPTTLYPLAAVIRDNGESHLNRIPWTVLSGTKHRYIPVFRIPLKTFKRKDLVKVLSTATEQLQKQMAPIKLEEIQFDLDCPERLLQQYQKIVQAYRKRYPNIHLSITALPSHLGNPAFQNLIACTDYYVLQVHGIEIPKRRADPVALLNRQTAEKAIRRAEAIRHPYRVALPCYAYELNFQPDTGEFLYLTAEKTTRRTDTIKKRIAADNKDLVELSAQISTLKYATGIIWFRLPVTKDQLCLPRASLLAIQQGSVPKPEVICRILPISKSTFEIELTNQNTIHAHSAIVELDWPDQTGSYDLFQHIKNEQHTIGKLPLKLTVSIPPPGKTVKLGWFQPEAQNDRPAIKVILK